MLKSLKNQLVLFSIGAILITSIIFIIINAREQAATEQLEYQEKAKAQSNLFQHIGKNSIIRLQENIFQATRNQALLNAIYQADISEIKRHAATFENRIVASHIVTDLRITDKNGTILYSKKSDELGKPIASHIAPLAAKEVRIRSGYEVFANELRNHYSFPLTQQGQVIGVIHFTLAPKLVFANFAALAGVSHWILVDDQGNTLASSAHIQDHIQLNKVNLHAKQLTTYTYQDKTYSQVSSPIEDYQGHHIATLSTFTDNTQFYHALSRTQYIAIAAIIAWLIIAALLTWLVIARKLRPLTQMKQIASHIEQTGDLSQTIHIHSQDEIGQSAAAINRLLALINHMMHDANSALEQVNQGNFSTEQLEDLTQNYHGDFATFMVNLKRSVNSVHFAMSELERVAQALQQGDFQVHMSTQVQGSIRQTMDALAANLSQIFDDINQVMARVTLSDFSRSVRIEAQGEFATLIHAINHSIKNLNKGFNEVVTTAQRMAEGDFSTPIQTNYQYAMGEAKQAINQSMQDISQTLAHIHSIAHQVEQEVHAVSGVTESLNTHIHQQAESLNNTSHTIQTTATQVAANLQSTQQAANIASGQKGLLVNTNTAMQHTQEAMLGIKEASEQISNITDIINNIAFQTNLLALNAAVEAARAGEHGRGFAVVAGEVRALAGKSSEAAKDISQLVDKTAQAVDRGVSRVDEINGYLQSITEETDKLLTVVTDITQASNEQAVNIHDANEAIHHIDQLSQHNAEQIETSQHTTQQMQQAASALIRSVSAFKLMQHSSVHAISAEQSS